MGDVNEGPRWLATLLDDTPAVTMYAPTNAGKIAYIGHVLGDGHVNCVNARERLERLGYDVRPFPKPATS